MRSIRTVGFALAFLAALPAEARETIGVVGAAGDLPRFLRSSQRRVLDPAEVRARLEVRAGGRRLDELRALAREGRRGLYSTGDFAAAADALSRAARGWLESGGGATPLPEIAKVLLDLSVALEATGDAQGAERELALALRLDPRLAADPAVHGPPVRRALERARSSRPRLYSRTVTTVPDGASINLDGRPQGASPIEVELSAGSHWLEVMLPGREPLSRRIEVSVGSETTIAVDLREASPARLALEALDAGPGGMEQAARLCREALDLDAVVAVIRNPEEVTAVRSGRGGALRTVHGSTLEEIRAALYPRLEVHGRPLQATDASPGQDPRAERGGSGSWWLWVGAGAVAVGAATLAIVIATSGSDERTLTREP